MKNVLLAAVAALSLAAPVAARAQDDPSYVAPQAAPSYAQAPVAANAEEDIHGRIVDFDGAYTLSVRDERGFVDNIQLHQGTIINPTGLTLAPGMVVNVLGYNAGPYLEANEIDTPYTIDAGVPYYDGQIWSYWGPSISLGFYFGNAGWWHGGYFGGPFAWNGGVRVYNNVAYRTVYRGSYRGGYGETHPRFPETRGTYSYGDRGSYSENRGSYSTNRGSYSGNRSYSAPARASYGGRSAGASHASHSSGGGGGHSRH